MTLRTIRPPGRTAPSKARIHRPGWVTTQQFTLLMHSKMTRILICILTSFLLASCAGTPDGGTPRDNPKKIDPDARRSSVVRGIPISRPRGQIYKSTPTQALELPPDLLNSSNDQVKEEIASFDPEFYRVLPPVKGARIVGDGDNQWLEVDSDADLVWEAMMEFWAISGIDLVNHNPEAGLMETEWIEGPSDVDEETSQGRKLAKQLLSAISQRGTSLDRYRLRFERLGENKTAVHVSHRWVARKEKFYGRKISQFEWVELPSNPERVSEFLQNIVLLFKEVPGTS